MDDPQNNQKFEQVIQVVASKSRLLRTWRLKGGISAEMTALEVEEPDGQITKLVVRQYGEGGLHTAEKEFRLLQLTQAIGLITPMPYHLDQSGQIFSAPYLVMEYIEGKPEFTPSNLMDSMFQLGSQLAKIHQMNGSNLDLSFLSEQPNECMEVWQRQPDSMNQVLAEGHIREVLKSTRPFTHQNPPLLLHGDYWPGNILWQDSRLVAVIDWEDASLGDPLIDVSISRLDIAWIFGREAMDAFTRHYQSMMPIDSTNLPYWDLCAALRLIRLAGSDLAEWVAFFPPFGRFDITEQTLLADYTYFITQAFEKLDLQSL